jgi:hypothetical protein
VEWIHLAQERDDGRQFEFGNNPLGTIKGRKFLDQLINY